jgi:glycosyltransferase involved in cell wall biosynthesis
MALRRPIRICRVIARMNVGGPAVHITQLTAGMDSERFAQLVVSGVEAPHEASMLALARARGVDPVIVPELGRELAARDDAVALLKLYRLFRRWRPDIVETHTAKAGTLGRLAAVVARVPVRVHVFHGHVFHGYFGPAKTRVFLEVERALARVTTRIVALGEAQRRELLELGVGAAPQVVSIPLGFDLAPYLAGTARGTLRAELGLPPGDDAPIVATVGRLAPIKRHDLLLRAARRVLDLAPATRFVVVGDGETRQATQRLAGELGIASRVHFLGWRENTALPALYADVDVVALTSDNEGMPVSLIEAMAAGVPVVATAAGGVPAVVRDGVTGLLAPPGDDAAIAGACLRLLQDPALRRRMGEAGRAAVYPQYDLLTLLSRMSGFYTSLVLGQPEAAPAVI